VLGAGPLAETFPEPLARLESDLWLAPLGEGIEQALLLTGTAPARALRRSPVVRDIDGWAVADLGHMGLAPVRHKLLRKLDPRPPARRLGAAWRTGRLSRALPALARDVVEQVDADLATVPRIDELSNGALLAVLDNGRTALRALHGYEVLAGMLIPGSEGGTTAASLALSALAEARAEGVDLDELVESSPVVLALAPPRIADGHGLTDLAVVPAAPAEVGATPAPASDGAVVREALRLRARWVQELTARAAWQLGHRLVCVGVLRDQDTVRLLGLDELRAAVVTRTAPADLGERIDPAVSAPRPLPAQFRLTPGNTPVAIAAPGAGANGVGAGGGSGSGPVHIGEAPPEGAVLVVTHLDPRLAPVVPRLVGLVAETGSPLSHLAILAREHGVPTVVGHAGATDRYQPGQVVEVDGTLGTVRVLADAAEPAQPAADVVDVDVPEAVEVADATGVAPSPGADGNTVVALPTRIVIDLTEDGAEPGTTSTRPNGDNVIPIGARR